MRSVTFETASLAAAVAKAARVAPTKGLAFDKVAGIMVEVYPEVYPDGETVVVRSTNLEVDYHETIAPLEIGSDEGGAGWEWRMPSALFAGFATSLPLSNKKVTMTQAAPGDRIVMKSGKTTARIAPIIGDSFKEWNPFDPALLTTVPSMASRVAAVGWATDRESVPLSGVHFDGRYIYATDRYKMVRMPCPVPLAEPVTVPLDTLTPVLAGVDDVRMAVEDRGLLLMTDDYTQMRTVIYDAKYPPLNRVLDSQQYDTHIAVSRTLLREAVRRMMSLVGRGERYPTIDLRVLPDRIDLEMEVEGTGNMTDSVDVVTTRVENPDIDPVEEIDTLLRFTPTYLTECLEPVGTETVYLSFRSDRPNNPLRVADREPDDSERFYEAWIQPKRPGMPEPTKDEADE
jgi:DNA polymerase III sliding clamp (beta) subunit (PCNA family)